ncbi:unnamed protein product [Clavelina lepadiformis]|uniref:Dynein light chain n=1 Tax=Clavelina lepadiformis TaxID=159417 RepID=A0ABP0GV21_CLALP
MAKLSKRKKVDIKKKEVSPTIEDAILTVATEAAKRCKTENERAEYIKMDLDDRFGGPWNVVIGKRSLHLLQPERPVSLGV